MKTEKFSSAFWCIYTPEAKVMLLGNVFSLGKKERANFHFGISHAFEIGKSSNSDLILMAGAKAPISQVTSLIVELLNTAELIEEDFSGIFNIGFRFQRSRFSVDLAGIRPLDATGGDFLFLPFLKVTIMLN